MPKRSPRISIWWDSDRYVCKFTFSYELVDFLHDLPKRDRKFDADEKTWSFRARHLDALLSECRRLGFVIEREDSEETEGSSRSESNSTETLLVSFFRLVPKAAMRAAYCKAAFALHPDHGGNTEAMQELNDLWQRIEREFYAAPQ